MLLSVSSAFRRIAREKEFEQYNLKRTSLKGITTESWICNRQNQSREKVFSKNDRGSQFAGRNALKNQKVVFEAVLLTLSLKFEKMHLFEQ